MTPVRTLAMVAAALLVAGSARAQAPLTIDDAVRLAIASHPSLAVAEAETDLAKAKSRAAVASYWPRVSFEEGWQRTNHPVLAFGNLLAERRFTAANFAIDALNHPEPVTNYRAAVTVEQLLFDGGRTAAATRAARAGERAADGARARAIAELTVATTQAFARLLKAQAGVAAARASVEVAEADLRRVGDRASAGLETEASRLSLQVRRDEVRAELVGATSEAEAAAAALTALVGRPVMAAEPLDTPAIPAEAPDETGTDVQQAVDGRPEVRSARAAEQAAEAALAEARRAAVFPAIAAAGVFEGNGAEYGNRASAWTAAVQARWSIGTGGTERSRIAMAAAGLRQAHAARLLAESSAAADVQTARAAMQAARARERATRDVVANATEAQRITRNRYEAGLASASDLLRMAEQLAGAERLRSGAVADLAVAAAALTRALGRGDH
jgi:outer membrane protein TolC